MAITQMIGASIQPREHPRLITGHRYLADDAAQLVSVDDDPLFEVTDLDKAIEAGSPTAQEGAPDTIAWDAVCPGGDIEAAMAESEGKLKLRLTQQRLFPTAMEC